MNFSCKGLFSINLMPFHLEKSKIKKRSKEKNTGKKQLLSVLLVKEKEFRVIPFPCFRYWDLIVYEE